MSHTPGRFGRAVVSRRRWIFAAWVVAGALLLPFASRVESVLEVTARLPGSEAVAVDSILTTDFRSPFAHPVFLVLRGVPSPNTDTGRALVASIADSIRTTFGVAAVASYADTPDSIFLGASGTFLLVGLDPARGRLDALIPPLRELTRRLETGARVTYPAASLNWTGEEAINFDLRQTSADEVSRAELRMLPVTLLLLLIAFGAVVASVLSLLAGGLAIALTLGAAVLMSGVWPLSILLQNVVSMIGLGVAIDYAMLTVSRFREELARGASVEDAAAEAAQHAGGTIALSGAAVIIGFAGLLFVPVSELRSIGVGGVMVVSVSVLLAATLLPGVLASLGTRVDMGRVLRRAPGTLTDDRWRRWGRFVATRPWRVLAAGIPLLLLAWQAPRLRAELPRGDWLPAAMQSARGLAELDSMGRGGVVYAPRIVVELPTGTSVYDPVGWTAVRSLGAALASDARVARVRSLPAVAPFEHPHPFALSLLPDLARTTLASPGGELALVELLPARDVSFNEITTLTRELRALDAGRASGLAGVRLRVGGMPAFNADYIDAVASRFVTIIALVVLGTFVSLVIGFRSVLIPVKAMILNLLSVGAAMGAVVLVFQDGFGGSLLGLAGPMEGVFPNIPILVFCIVFGLSMDYEVFLVSRVAEARRAGLAETEALAEGLARTGGVITSAAMIMVTIFAAFMLGEFLLIKVLGFALAVAVAVDATLVRVAVGPALLRLAGRWNWWPARPPAIP